MCLEITDDGHLTTARAGTGGPAPHRDGRSRLRPFLGRLRPFLHRFCSFLVPYAERRHFLTRSPEKFIKNGPGTISNGSDRTRFGRKCPHRTADHPSPRWPTADPQQPSERTFPRVVLRNGWTKLTDSSGYEEPFSSSTRWYVPLCRFPAPLSRISRL